MSIGLCLLNGGYCRKCCYLDKFVLINCPRKIEFKYKVNFMKIVITTIEFNVNMIFKYVMFSLIVMFFIPTKIFAIDGDYNFGKIGVRDIKYDLGSFEVKDNNLKYTEQSQFTFNEKKGMIVSYNGNESCVNIPNEINGVSVTQIGQYAFGKCNNLNKVVIPASVKKINMSAFLKCNNLEEVIFNEGLDEIDDYAFEDCSKLVNITLPKSLTNIGIQAFSNCYGLTQLILSNDYMKIEANAFGGCKNLNKIYIYGDKITFDKGVFAKCYNLQHLYISKNIESMQKTTFVPTDAEINFSEINFYVENQETKSLLHNNGIRNERIMLNGVIPPSDWIQDSIGWRYLEGNSYAIGWRIINGKYYYFYKNGYMAHDCCISDSNADYTLGSDGALSKISSKVLGKISGPHIDTPEIEWYGAPESKDYYSK